MLNMYVGKQLVKVDETNLLGMDINTLKSIPYDVAKKYAEYISALEVCIEDILDMPTDISNNASYTVALWKLEHIIKKEEAMVVENGVVV